MKLSKSTINDLMSNLKMMNDKYLVYQESGYYNKGTWLICLERYLQKLSFFHEKNNSSQDTIYAKSED